MTGLYDALDDDLADGVCGGMHLEFLNYSIRELTAILRGCARRPFSALAGRKRAEPSSLGKRVQPQIVTRAGIAHRRWAVVENYRSEALDSGATRESDTPLYVPGPCR